MIENQNKTKRHQGPLSIPRFIHSFVFIYGFLSFFPSVFKLVSPLPTRTGFCFVYSFTGRQERVCVRFWLVPILVLARAQFNDSSILFKELAVVVVVCWLWWLLWGMFWNTIFNFRLEDDDDEVEEGNWTSLFPPKKDVTTNESCWLYTPNFGHGHFNTLRTWRAPRNF